MESQKTCASCKYIHQHYVKSLTGNWIPVDCGHCGEPHLRTRKPSKEACQRWEAKEDS